MKWLDRWVASDWFGYYVMVSRLWRYLPMRIRRWRWEAWGACYLRAKGIR